MLRKMAAELGINFPFCFDQTQEVARSFEAVCTPDFYLYDQNRRLAYHGQLDDSRPGSSVLMSARDLRTAIDSLHSGHPIPTDPTPSIGCSIKWKRSPAPPSDGIGTVSYGCWRCSYRGVRLVRKPTASPHSVPRFGESDLPLCCFPSIARRRPDQIRSLSRVFVLLLPRPWCLRAEHSRSEAPA